MSPKAQPTCSPEGRSPLVADANALAPINLLLSGGAARDGRRFEALLEHAER
jgi:hypothetical protein